MRIERLDLKAFGLFTEQTLDLAGDGMVHVVYGANEAGKTTALRAISDLFFGIPERTTDAFLHPQTALRVGAVLRGPDGTLLEIVRRKGRKETLLGPDGSPVADAVLARLLPGVERELFKKMFGLSHDRLVSGGRELLDARGSLGEALFGAGLGEAGIHALLHELESAADALFKPQASVPRVNAALRELEEALKQSKDLALRPAEWHTHADALDNALRDLATLDAEIVDHRRELGRLERLQRILPLVAQRGHLLAQRALVTPAREVPDEAIEARRKASINLEDALAARGRADDRITQLERDRGAITVQDALLARAEEVTTLVQKVGVYTKAGLDLPRVEVELRDAEKETNELASTLFTGEAIDEVAQRRPHPAVLARVAELAGEHGALAARVSAVEEGLADKRVEVARAEEVLAGTARARDTGRLEAALAEAQAAGSLEQQLAEVQAGLRDVEAEGTAGIAALGLWRGGLDEVEVLPLPAAETVDRFERDLAASERERGLLTARADDARMRVADAERRLAELAAAGELPSDDDLAEARSWRERGWTLVRAAWLDGAADETAVEAFDAERPLDRAYEASVAEADRVADIRLLEADRLAGVAQAESAREEAARDMAQAEAALSDLAKREESLAGEWRAAWTPARIEPLPPIEMRAWLARYRDFATLAARRRTLEAEAERHTFAATRHSGALGEALRLLELTGGEDGETLSGLVARAAEELRAVQEANRSRDEADRRLGQLSVEAASLTSRVDRAQAELDGWREGWTKAVAPLGIPSDSSPAEAQAVVNSLDRLFGALERASSLRRRVEGMQRDRTAFSEAAAGLAAGLAPDLASLAPEHAAGGLAERLAASQADAVVATRIDGQIADERTARDEADRLATETSSRLADSVAQAGCRDLDDLLDAEQRSLAVRQHDACIAEIEDGIVVAGAHPLDKLVQEAEGVSPEDVEAALPGAQAEVGGLEERRGHLFICVGAEQQELAGMDGSDGATVAAEQAQSLVARIRREAEEYARLRLAAALLRRAIEHYREESQGPLVKRVDELFPVLTIGSFEGVAVDYDAHDEPVLVGVRDGAHVTVEGMSAGTRDQLYLALRIASLERFADAADPPPLIADDLFLNFDDERARAGLKVLAGLTERMQVMFFTHHRHLVDIARDAIPGSVLRVHELASPTWPPNA